MTDNTVLKTLVLCNSYPNGTNFDDILLDHVQPALESELNYM